MHIKLLLPLTLSKSIQAKAQRQPAVLRFVGLRRLKMNILHHKSWHVRNKDNIERVRRDEAKAKEEEKERQKRAALAEQEARTNFLRQKAKERIGDGRTKERIEDGSDIEKGLTESADVEISHQEDTYTSSSLTTDIYSGERGHINFFKGIEDGQKEEKSNKEHEKEKKAEKEKWEKNVGILTYLGQSASKEQGSTDPWYLTSKKRKRLEDEDEDSKIDNKEKKRKSSMDPIHDMKQYLSKKKKHKSKDKHKHHKHKKDKKEKVRKETKSTPSKTIEQLRSERLKRELDERQKAAALMAKVRGEKSPEESSEKVEVSDRNRKYNSQYNPDFIRNPKSRHREYY